MSEDTRARFLLDDDGKVKNFVYRSPNVGNSNNPIAINATPGEKFALGRVILDDWWILGGTPWFRFKFRMKHPIIYSKRGLRNLYRRIKRIFVKDLPSILCRTWKNKEEMFPNE